MFLHQPQSGDDDEFKLLNREQNATDLAEPDQVDDVQSTGFGFGQLEVVRRKAGTSPDVIRKAP